MKSPTAECQDKILPYSQWTPLVNSLHNKYTHASPFPHTMIENFLTPQAIEEALLAFPSLGSADWIHYVHLNEKKFGKNDKSSFHPALRSIIDELNSDRFLGFLTELTGIKGLFADESLEGGGLHQSGPGGYLNIHADFTSHPHHRDWHRRVNVLVYLNKNWENKYNGHLELWDRKMRRRVRKIAPVFNRCVIFNTDEDAFHGHPKPLACPPGTTRKSIALYYYVKHAEPKLMRVHSTNYKARPYDGFKSVFIYADKLVLALYDRVKRIFGMNDKIASKLLKTVHHISLKLKHIFILKKKK